MFEPRPKQHEVLTYRGGFMGVAAVPGSGKTRTLSYLAAQLVKTAPLAEGQEILVVTLVNSAVGNFARQVGEFVQQEGLFPGVGYRVRTLHGLANDIVRERPALAGLAEDFVILDEHETEALLQEAVDAWIRAHPAAPDGYLAPEYSENKRARHDGWPKAVSEITQVFIRQAKDMQLTPETVSELRVTGDEKLPLVEMCLDIYSAYERGLRYRGAVDFQDLIRLAVRAIEHDADYLKRLQFRWPYILEDEAQDSSKLQEHILRQLVGANGNWVRVGDPNQAIYETFTTASPKFLRDFMVEPRVQARELPNSGRSTRSIIRLANQLIVWSLQHPNLNIRVQTPLSRPYIEPTPPGDPQGNPPDNPAGVHVSDRQYTPFEERKAVITSLQHWLANHADSTVAVLLPMNASGSEMADMLRGAGIDYVENLRTTTPTRAVVGALAYVLKSLLEPTNSRLLGTVYRVWMRDVEGDSDADQALEEIVRLLNGLEMVEDFIAPLSGDWLAGAVPQDEHPDTFQYLVAFRDVVRRWQEASVLPVDQLLLTISGDLFNKESEIATAYSLALYMARFAEAHPEARMPEYADELVAIARNQRQFTGLSEEDDAFDPDSHRGKVTVTTVHKAKGLEWDRVHLMSVNNYDYPSVGPFDTFIGEKWFARQQLNLTEEALAQLKALADGTRYIEGDATQEARIKYAGERLRLLYVGITRARSELIITWNNGRRHDKHEALPLAALRGWWEEENVG